MHMNSWSNELHQRIIKEERDEGYELRGEGLLKRREGNELSNEYKLAL